MGEDSQAPRHKILIFGGSGAIGSAISEGARARGWDAVITTRGVSDVRSRADVSTGAWDVISIDPFAEGFTASELEAKGPYSAVCWAQGANLNDSIYTVDLHQHLELYRANCAFVLATLNLLLSKKLLDEPARLCVVSSIWQKISRQDKLSYCMTKAALQGLVLSASTDLAADGHLINAVLPGALDTPMTRANLSEVQLARLKSATKFDRLPRLEDVTSLVLYLCSRENTGITGQFIAADLGFSNVHLL